MREDIEAALGGLLFATLGHERHLVRRDVSRELDHLVGRGHLEVQERLDRASQNLHVPVLNVTPVFPEMNRDAVGARVLREHGRFDWIRIQRAARLPERGHVIDVDVESDGHELTLTWTPGVRR